MKRLEAEIIPNSNICVCPDALSMIATPFYKLCYKCGREIDTTVWKYWRVIRPHDENTNFYPFALKRDDNQELTDLPIEDFDQEVFFVGWQIQWMELGIFDWINALSESEQKRKLAELLAISKGEIDLEESKIKEQLNEYQKQNQENRTSHRN